MYKTNRRDTIYHIQTPFVVFAYRIWATLQKWFVDWLVGWQHLLCITTTINLIHMYIYKRSLAPVGPVKGNRTNVAIRTEKRGRKNCLSCFVIHHLVSSIRFQLAGHKERQKGRLEYHLSCYNGLRDLACPPRGYLYIIKCSLPRDGGDTTEEDDTERGLNRITNGIKYRETGRMSLCARNELKDQTVPWNWRSESIISTNLDKKFPFGKHLTEWFINRQYIAKLCKWFVVLSAVSYTVTTTEFIPVYRQNNTIKNSSNNRIDDLGFDSTSACPASLSCRCTVVPAAVALWWF